MHDFEMPLKQPNFLVKICHECNLALHCSDAVGDGQRTVGET